MTPRRQVHKTLLFAALVSIASAAPASCGDEPPQRETTIVRALMATNHHEPKQTPEILTAQRVKVGKQVQVSGSAHLSDPHTTGQGATGTDDISMIDGQPQLRLAHKTQSKNGDRSGQMEGQSALKLQQRLRPRPQHQHAISRRQTTGAGAGPSDLQDASSRTVNHSSSVDTSALKCRVEKDFFLDFHEYVHYTCANCYDQVPHYLFWQKLIFKPETRIWLYDDLTNWRFLPNQTQIVGATFKKEANLKMWLACCAAAVECCKANAKYLPSTKNARGQLIDDPGKQDSCPATWDGFSCWPMTKSDSYAKQSCPSHVYILHDQFKPVCFGTVQKRCFSNGSWYIRNGHEWSDYRDCKPEPLYATRMRYGGIWHIISALVMCPALIILSKVPNRHKSKRVRIMSNILFYLLINCIFNAAYKFGVIMHFFTPGIDHSANMESEEATIPIQTWQGLSQHIANYSQLPDSLNQTGMIQYMGGGYEPQLMTPTTAHSPAQTLSRQVRDDLEFAASSPSCDNLQRDLQKLALNRTKRSEQTGVSSLASLRRQRVKATPPVIILCWFTSVMIRFTRSLSYAWMFTGAVYLCAILHYAPAEPPAPFIKSMMFLTNAIPLSLGFVYLILRTIFEPSPLKLFIAVPYYYILGEQEAIDRLWKSELSCWTLDSQTDFIENVALIPNFIFVVLNVGLLIATLWIMCNISRPGSTRNEMSFRDYIRAAGTLVLLYGVHSALLTAMPSADKSCWLTQLAYYSFTFVDGLQGVAVSYVFCYKTADCREVVHKWWSGFRGRGRSFRKVSSNLDSSQRRRSKGSINGSNDHHYNSKYNHSTRSNNSAYCNGREVTTELIDIEESPVLDRRHSGNGIREIL